jgi:hypothetical protein
MAWSDQVARSRHLTMSRPISYHKSLFNQIVKGKLYEFRALQTIIELPASGMIVP